MKDFNLFIKQCYIIVQSIAKKKCRSKNPRVVKANKEKIIILSKCVLRDTKKLRFIKNQETIVRY